MYVLNEKENLLDKVLSLFKYVSYNWLPSETLIPFLLFLYTIAALMALFQFLDAGK